MADGLAVSTKRLTKAFQGREVIHNCTMSVERGTIYGFLGKNGAGKTTVFKILLGLLKPASGEAEVLGLNTVKHNTEILKRTGSLIETPVFYEHLPAVDNLKLHLSYMGVENGDIEEALNRVGCRIPANSPSPPFHWVCASGWLSPAQSSTSRSC